MLGFRGWSRIRIYEVATGVLSPFVVDGCSVIRRIIIKRTAIVFVPHRVNFYIDVARSSAQVNRLAIAANAVKVVGTKG